MCGVDVFRCSRRVVRVRRSRQRRPGTPEADAPIGVTRLDGVPPVVEVVRVGGRRHRFWEHSTEVSKARRRLSDSRPYPDVNVGVAASG